jgi:hypothetical protein
VISSLLAWAKQQVRRVFRRDPQINFETEFPGLTRARAIATAADVAFYLDGYDIALNEIMAARGHKRFLGPVPSVCRFCTPTAPAVGFRPEAHAVPQLAGNGTLLSRFECHDCNQRFQSFDDDLGKITLLDRIAGQVIGRTRRLSVKQRHGRSRVQVNTAGLKIDNYTSAPIAEIDYDAKTLTIEIEPPSYRPLGVFKGLVKMALTFMDETHSRRFRKLCSGCAVAM